MAGQYSHKQFFRRTPNASLAAYFAKKKLDIGVDFAKIKETDSEAIFNGFNTLTEEQQGNVEAQFQDLNAMACEAGIQALIDEAVFHNDEEFAEQIAEIEGFHAKVIWAFLEKAEYWRGASMFLHADNVSYSFWKKRNDLPHVKPCVDDENIQALADAISQFFRTSQGRGKNCKVEPYRRNDKEYFFAYPEDYAQSGVEWVSDKLKTRARHPAFEIIFVYTEAEGSLDIYAPRNTKAVPELQKLFAKCILKLDTLEDGQIDARVYDLKPVANESFEFQIEPEMGIASAVVTRLRLSLHHGKLRRVILEANTSQNPRAVYDLLDELKPPAYNVTQLGVKVVFESVDGRRAKTKTFNISYPNSCALSHDGQDLAIREMLAKSGLEPQAAQNLDKGA